MIVAVVRICASVSVMTALLASEAPVASEAPIERIVVASCLNQRAPAPLLRAAAARDPDLLLMLGDNVYADTSERAELAACYRQLAAHRDFAVLRSAADHVLATWDDHDYGENDGGADFAARAMSEELFEDFWYPADDPRRERAGVYGAAIFGPPGQRLQVILLDTRFFRSPRERGDERASTMLGEDQWAWLAQELRRPAELRILCSSIQVLADSHRFEKWSDFPHERARLLALLRETEAGGLVLCSGDRHLGTLLRDEQALAHPLYELTASGVNVRTYDDAPDPKRVGTACARQHYGTITIDWAAGILTFGLHAAGDATVLEVAVPVAELAAP